MGATEKQIPRVARNDKPKKSENLRNRNDKPKEMSSALSLQKMTPCEKRLRLKWNAQPRTPAEYDERFMPNDRRRLAHTTKTALGGLPC